MLVPFFKRVVYKILNKKTEEEKLRMKIRILKELLEEMEKEEPKTTQEHAERIAEQFYVDSVVVSKHDGSVVIGREEAFEKMVKASSLYEYINSEFPGTRMLLIKDRDKYNIIYAENDLLYFFKTSGEISSIEAKRMAERIREKIKVAP